MKTDWKRKLTSRKFWAAVAGFVSMLMIYFGKDAGNAEQVAALIMAGASLVAYMIGEGLADSADRAGTLSGSEEAFLYDFGEDGDGDV
ncbi:MAG: hypothetical protein IJT27_00600 [Clostridia bacterium]|nr:hypothetical protein [Clostridia bacterium]